MVLVELRWAVALLVLGCTPRSPAMTEVQSTCKEPVAEKRQAAPVIMSLQTRNHEVTVHTTDDGLRFTVAMGDRVLFEQLDELEFQRNFPGLHQHFETAFADERGGGGWAGL